MKGCKPLACHLPLVPFVIIILISSLSPPSMIQHVPAGYCSIRIHRRVEDGLRLHHDGSDGPQPHPAAGTRLTQDSLSGGLIL